MLPQLRGSRSTTGSGCTSGSAVVWFGAPSVFHRYLGHTHLCILQLDLHPCYGIACVKIRVPKLQGDAVRRIIRASRTPPWYPHFATLMLKGTPIWYTLQRPRYLAREACRWCVGCQPPVVPPLSICLPSRAALTRCQLLQAPPTPCRCLRCWASCPLQIEAA